MGESRLVWVRRADFRCGVHCELAPAEHYALYIGLRNGAFGEGMGWVCVNQVQGECSYFIISPKSELHFFLSLSRFPTYS